MTRELSTQAQVAKLIRQDLKRHGIKARVRSESASMMNAVRVKVYNQPPWAFDAIESHCIQYQYGHFNGMEDIYEYSNSRDDIPQVKYMTVNNEFDDDHKRRAWEYLREHSGNFEDAPGDFREAHNFSWRFNGAYNFGDSVLWEVLNGSYDARLPDGCVRFWNKPRVRVGAEPPKAGGYRIEKHHHDKRGQDFWICIPEQRLSREDFEAARDAAKAAGGWYSRKWRGTPGGFGFNTEPEAVAFAGGSPPIHISSVI